MVYQVMSPNNLIISLQLYRLITIIASRYDSYHDSKSMHNVALILLIFYEYGQEYIMGRKSIELRYTL